MRCAVRRYVTSVAGARGFVAAEFDLRKPPAGFIDDPYPFLKELRTHDPVHRCPDGSYFLTRWDDLSQVYKDKKTFSSDKRAEFAPKMIVGSPIFRHHTTSLVFNDEPLHRRVRGVVNRGFAPAAVAAMEPMVADVVKKLLDRAEEMGSFDMIHDLAASLPVEVVCDVVGITGDREQLRDWSLAILGALEPAPGEELLRVANAAVTDFCAVLADIAQDRRTRASGPGDDVIGKLVAAEFDGGEKLSEEELLQNVIFLLNAGHETTTNLIGNGMDALFRFPEQHQRLLNDPSLMHTAVDELLRFEAPIQLNGRRAVTDCTIGGVPVPAGSPITLCLAAANRDPAKFPDPDELDVGRKPNQHSSFGFGIHNCVGQQLARLEGRVVFTELLRRFPKLRRSGEAERSPRIRFRGFLRYPVAVS